MLRVVGRPSGENLRLEVARTFGTRCAVAVCACIAAYFSWQLWRERSLYQLVVATLTALCAWLIHGESEEAVFDAGSDSVRLEKRVPFRRLLVLRLGPLSQLQAAWIEKEPTNAVFQRLMLEFESGHTFPLTDAYLDTRVGVMCAEGAGLKDALALIERRIVDKNSGNASD
jgi:hypothetical protein